MSLRPTRAAGLLSVYMVLAILLSAGLSTAPAGAAMQKGLQDMRLVMSDHDTERQLFWSSAERAGVSRVRVLVSWDGKATTIDPVVAARIRRASAEGEEAGARLFVGIYAAINRKRSHPIRITNRMITRFSRFTASIGTELQDLPLAGYLTWNEPNFRSMWPLNQPRSWVKMSNAAYRSFKRTDRSTPVLVGEPAPNARTSNAIDPGAFFRKALCLNDRYRSSSRSAACRTRLLADGFAIHVHDFVLSPLTARANQDAWTIGNLGAARKQIRAMARAGRITPRAARNLHITEFAYRTSGSHRTSNRTAARWLNDAWKLAKRQGIRSFTWYQLQDPGEGHGWTSGLLTFGGSERPSWKAYRLLR